MARTVHIRHLRHRRLDGLARGPSERPRLRHTDSWIDRTVTRLGSTADQRGFVADFAQDDLIMSVHGLANGDGPFHAFTDGTLPAGLATATDYWVSGSPNDAVNRLRVHATHRDAELAINHVPLTDGGSGLPRLELILDSDAVVDHLRQGLTSHQIEVATDVDDLV